MVLLVNSQWPEAILEIILEISDEDLNSQKKLQSDWMDKVYSLWIWLNIESIQFRPFLPPATKEFGGIDTFMGVVP